MEEAAGKADNQPDSASKPKRAMTEEEMAAWADLLAVASELQFDQELDAGVPQEALPEDWERRLEPRTAAGPAGAGAVFPPDGEELGPAGDEPALETEPAGQAWLGMPEDEPPFQDEAVEQAWTAPPDRELFAEDEAAAVEGEPDEQEWAAMPEREPFFEHPLYVEAMQALAAGKGTVVASSLRELAELYPEEPAVGDLLLRMELKSAVAQTRELPVDHRQAAPALQNALTFLLLLTIGLAGIAGFYVAFNNLVRPVWDANRLATDIRVARTEVDRRLAAGDWNGAREALLELQRLEPENVEIAPSLAHVDRQKQLSDWYADALAAQEAGDLQGALLLLEQIQSQEPGYRADVAARIENLQLLLALEDDWLAAEGRVQAEQWEETIALLLDIRRRDPEYRAQQVKERLFQIYERLARQSLNEAGGSVDRLREALIYLNGALAEQPTNRELAAERKLALSFVKGADARARGDWLAAAEEWEKIYAQQRDYQGAVLAGWLKEARPQAARQAIAEARGSVKQLEQAAGYLDRAIVDWPEDEGLRQDRALVAAYLDGAMAFEAGYWNQAIRYWGPLFAAQPGYQDGALERNLREACGASPEPDLALCPP